MGMVWVTPSPESHTIPVTLPAEYKDNKAYIYKVKAGTLKVSKNIWVIFSLFYLGFIGASVNITGCSEGSILNSL